MYRTYSPRVGQVFLSGRTFYPRTNCPAGQNLLGECVRQIPCPMDRFSYNSGILFSIGFVFKTSIEVHKSLIQLKSCTRVKLG